MTPAEERYWLLTRAKDEPDPAKRQAMLAGAALQQLERMADAAGRLPDEVYGLRVEVASGFEQTQAILRDMLASVEEGRRHHRAGLALQQEMLRRDDFQAGAEQLIFELAKAVRTAENAPPGTDPTVLLFSLESRLDAISAVTLSTPLIRGLENKRAFEDAVATAHRLRDTLRELDEVQEALRWANDQQRLREEAEERERQTKDQRWAAEVERRRRELKAEEERLRVRRAEVKKNPPKRKQPAWPEVPFRRWLRLRGLSATHLLVFALATCCCPGTLLNTSIHAIASPLFKPDDVPVGFVLVYLACWGGCLALPLLTAGAFWWYDGAKENAQVRRAMREVLGELDIITLNSGDGDPDAPDYRLVLGIAESVAYGREDGSAKDAPPKLTADQAEGLARLVSAQPWAVMKPQLVGKRGLDTPDGVTQAVAAVARRFEGGRPKVSVLGLAAAAWVCLTAILFVCVGMLGGSANSKKQPPPSGVQPTTGMAGAGTSPRTEGDQIITPSSDRK